MEARHYGACDLCDQTPTHYRCGLGCDYDLCSQCAEKKIKEAHEQDSKRLNEPKDTVIRSVALANETHGLDEASYILCNSGVVGLSRVHSRSHLNELKAFFTEYFVKIESALNRRDLDMYGGEPFFFSEVCWRSEGRVDVRLEAGTCPPLKALLEEWNRGELVGLLESALGPRPKLLFAGVVLSRPGAEGQPWHTDGDHLFPATEGNDCKRDHRMRANP